MLKISTKICNTLPIFAYEDAYEYDQIFHTITAARDIIGNQRETPLLLIQQLQANKTSDNFLKYYPIIISFWVMSIGEYQT